LQIKILVYAGALFWSRFYADRTYSSQSTANSSDISDVGRPSAESTSSMVMRAALGMDAAPILASVAVKLNKPIPYRYSLSVQVDRTPVLFGEFEMLLL
jgi:hypothetical protein